MMYNPIAGRWRVPVLLIGVCLIPFAATINRLNWLRDADVTPDPAMARFDSSWTFLVVHILLGSVFLLMAAPQFSPELRARHRNWHGLSGRVTMSAGIVAGLSGVWLVLAYPPSALATPIMDLARVMAGAALTGSIVLAFVAIRKRNIPTHRAWMIRAFALAVAGSTQALLIGFWLAFAGELTPDSATVLITLGFAFNMAFAEWRIQATSPIRSPENKAAETAQ